MGPQSALDLGFALLLKRVWNYLKPVIVTLPVIALIEVMLLSLWKDE